MKRTQLKGIKKLEKKINKAFRDALYPIGDLPKMYAGTDFVYHTLSEEITFGLAVTEASDRLWKKWLLDNFNLKATNIFVLSILHELGHWYTLDSISEEDYEHCIEQKLEIEQQLDAARPHSKDWNEIYSSYWDLTDEYMATEWAVDWIETNPEAAKTLCNKCNKALVEFFLKNEVIDE